MLKATLKNILGHKFRVFTTGFAVLLGVMFLAGSMILTDTVGATFDALAADVNAGTDAFVRGTKPFDTPEGPGGVAERPQIPRDLVDAVRDVDGVADVQPTILGFAQLIGADGKTVGGNGPPTFGGNWREVDELNAYDLVEGRAPEASGEVVVDRGLSERAELGIGDRTTALTRAGAIEVTIVGVASFGALDSAGGSTFTAFTMEDAERLLGEPGKLSGIAVTAEPGVSQEELRDRVAAAMPDTVEVATGAEVIAESQDEFDDLVSGFGTFLQVFAYIALFVGSFIIYNTFQIIVAQRLREVALLRAIGASRRQVLGSILLEALAVGVIASLLGFVAGIGVAIGVDALMSALNFDLPAEGLDVRATTMVLSVLVGVVVTLVAAFFPARRGSRVPPLAAMRDVVVETTRISVVRLVAGVVITLAGMATVLGAIAVEGGNELLFIGLGAAVTFIGVTTLGPIAARPVTRFFGAPLLRMRGVTGNLARENAMRNPKRTSRTAAALMIGVALVSAITVVASSVKASFEAIVDEQFQGDYVVSAGSPFGGGGVSPAVSEELREQDELAAVMPIRFTAAQVDLGDGPDEVTLVAIDAVAGQQITDVGVLDGSLDALGTDGFAVHEDVAEEQDLAVGDPVTVRFVDTGEQRFVVKAIYANRDLARDYYVDLAAFERNVARQFDVQILVRAADGVPAGQVRRAIESVTDPYPNVDVLDREEFKEFQAGFIDVFVAIVYGMLALALIIALFGIANTIALSVVERTRELGLLRAVGMTRGQLRSAVRWEAFLVALFGCIGGLAVGLFFGWALMQALEDDGLGVFDVPVTRLVVIAVLASLAGVVAALLPARRAARLDVLQAIAHS